MRFPNRMRMEENPPFGDPIRECRRCENPGAGDPGCQDTSTQFCTPCGELNDKLDDGVGCSENRECDSGTCYQGTCGIPCSDGCTASQYCGSDDFCKEKVGQDDSCSATIECLDNLFCDQRQATPTCNTCDNAYGDEWIIDVSCVVTGFVDDASPEKHGSTSSTKYKSESSALSVCTNTDGCQGITQWAIDTGPNGWFGLCYINVHLYVPLLVLYWRQLEMAILQVMMHGQMKLIVLRSLK